MNWGFVMFIEIEYLTLQYWATSASVFSVLLFLAFTIRRSHWGVKFSLSLAFFQALLCVAALLTTSQIGKFCFVLDWIVFWTVEFYVALRDIDTCGYIR
jgi:hypothetical protein